MRPKQNFNQDNITPLKMKLPEIPDGFILLQDTEKIDPYTNTPRVRPVSTIDGFNIVQDTREQLPLFSPQRLAKGVLHKWKDKVPIAGDTVKVGDYTVAGLEDVTCIELKRWSDFLSYVGRERQDHTIPKLERMSKMKFAALVIHENQDSLYFPQMYGFSTKMTTNQVRGFLRSVRVRYGIHTFASESLELCQMYILDSLVAVYNQSKESENETGGSNG